jgi:DNA-binding transcriptional regulator YhcF (GntR family)
VTLSLDDGKPIFQQIAERIENDIIEGKIREGEQVPSTNQFASFYQINPATAAKGINLLVEEGILYKKRGIGMFVSAGAQEQLLEKRRQQFFEKYVLGMLREAKKLRISKEDIIAMIERGVPADGRGNEQ